MMPKLSLRRSTFHQILGRTRTGPVPEPAEGRFELVDSPIGRIWFRADDDVIRPAVKSSGHWEPEVEGMLRRFIEPGCRFLDIGANIGWFSVFAASHAAGIEIDAVEPVPESLAALRMNLWTHAPAARIHPCALGASRGVAVTHEALHNPGDARLLPAATTAQKLTAVVTGDELFAGRSFDVIKVDVQGAEVDVMIGLERTISRSSELRCVVEFQPSALAEYGQRAVDALHTFRTLGFRIEAQIGTTLQSLPDNEIVAACASGGPNGYVTLILSR